MLDRSIQVSLQRSGSLVAEVRIVSAKGGVRWANFSGMVLLNAAHGGPERIIGVARDVTDRKNGVQERDLLVKRLEREHATLSAVVGGMSDGLIVADSNHLVELCNDRALSLLGTERHLVLGRPLAEVCGLALPELMGTAGRVDWRTALSRADDQPTFEASVAGPPPRELEVHLFSIRGGADGFWTGILILDRSAVKLLSLLEERERIAMDLHDGVIQSLYAVALGLAARERTLPPDSRRTLRAVLQQTRSQLSNVIREIRDYIGDLRLDRLGEHNLIAGLQELGTQLNANGLLLLDFELDTEAASVLDAEASANLLYIAHEATSNIVRHARAGSASILLQQDEDLVSLTVRDDGRGFNPRMAGRRSGDGLRNMAERARLLGGSLIVKSEPGQGAEVRLDLPLSRTQIQRAGPGGDAPTRSAPRTVVSS
jgi:signal transduction histidine kinase